MLKSPLTCFGSHRIHHQGALYSAWLKYKYGSIVSVDMDVVGVMAAYSDPLCLCVVHYTGRRECLPIYWNTIWLFV